MEPKINLQEIKGSMVIVSLLTHLLQQYILFLKDFWGAFL